YGPPTLALHVLEKPTRSIGVDVLPASVSRARDLVRRLEVEGADFHEADLTAAGDVVPAQAEVLIVNNSIYYLPTRRLQRRALESFFRVLRPGGAVVILTPNRRHHRDPFTGLLGLHWLPKWLATPYVRLRKKRATYDDVRVPSPFELTRWASRVGFRDIRVV